MNTHAEYQILGRVGSVNEAGPTLKVSIAAEYGRKDDRGEFQSKPFWNTVTVFRESTVKWIKDSVQTGDLVMARGTIRQTNYEKDGEIQYGVTLAAEQFSRLARKKTDSEVTE